jgi:hypothetical protein
MHYKNGREAKVGDPVIGTGYNIKGVIAGIVAGLTPGSDTCNIRVLTLQQSEAVSLAGLSAHVHSEYIGTDEGKPEYETSLYRTVTEHGAVSSFLHAEDALEPKAVEVPIAQNAS